jgi:hypothetical protein
LENIEELWDSLDKQHGYKLLPHSRELGTLKHEHSWMKAL